MAISYEILLVPVGNYLLSIIILLLFGTCPLNSIALDFSRPIRVFETSVLH